MKVCKDLSVPDAAYLAGLFDGEGCLTSIIKPRNGGKSRTLHPTLSIANTCREVIDWAVFVTGVGRVNSSGDKGRIKECWRYVLESHSELEGFLRQIRPYVLIKGEQVDTVLEFIYSRMSRAGRAAFSEYEIELLFNLRIFNNHNSKSKKFVYCGKSYDLQQFKQLILDNRKNENYFVIEWTAEMDELLGTDSDRVVAERLGLKLAAVQRRRYALRIPPAKATRWAHDRYA